MPRPESTEQRSAFETWYKNDKEAVNTLKLLPDVKPATFYSWMQRYKWHDRAKELDAKLAKQRAPQMISESAAMLKAQKQVGALLRLKGVEYLTKAGAIQDGRTAILAVKTGIELERQAIGLPDYVTEILNAPVDQLRATVADMERRRRASLADNAGEDSAGGFTESGLAN
jgi:hypothetical protein